jgi:hypothetical protein
MTNPTFERAVSYLRLEERRLLKLCARVYHTALAAGSAMAPRCPQRPPRRPLLRCTLRRPSLRPRRPYNNSNRGVVVAGVAATAAPTVATRAAARHLPTRCRPGAAASTLGRGSCTLTPCPCRAPRPRHSWPSSAGSSGPLRRAAAALCVGLWRYAVLRALPAGRLGPCARRRSSAGCSCGLFWWHAVAHGLWRLHSHGCLPG